jgi:hypothetical protein
MAITVTFEEKKPIIVLVSPKVIEAVVENAEVSLVSVNTEIKAFLPAPRVLEVQLDQQGPQGIQGIQGPPGPDTAQVLADILNPPNFVASYESGLV